MRGRHSHLPGRYLVGLLLAVSLLPGFLLLWRPVDAQQPTFTPDPLAVPELPPNPSQIDLGRVAYFYNCMPCHGDQGQGLTDEWRATWVEDHQNCWARGCHTGRPGDEGFPLPTVIPAVAGQTDRLGRFHSGDELHDYLVQSHPPQRPGALTDEEYLSLTAFLLAKNGRSPVEARDESGSIRTVALVLGLFACALAVQLWRGRRLL